MYAWVWRHLPGPTPVRALIALLLVALVVGLLLFVIYPKIDPLLPFNHVNVSDPNG
jgi:hypothetical protein